MRKSVGVLAMLAAASATVGGQQPPAFASVSLGGTPILLSGPGASGSRPLPDGRKQEPGGWNRVVLQVADLPAHIEKLKTSGVRFRNTMEVGPAGRQIQLEDPDGNPIAFSAQGLPPGVVMTFFSRSIVS